MTIRALASAVKERLLDYTTYSHFLFGWLTAKASYENPVLAGIMFAVFMAYQLFQYMAKGEDVSGDFVEYAAGIIAYLAGLKI